MNLYTQMWK